MGSMEQPIQNGCGGYLISGKRPLFIAYVLKRNCVDSGAYPPVEKLKGSSTTGSAKPSAFGKGKLKYTTNGKQKYNGNGKQKCTIKGKQKYHFSVRRK